MADKTRLLNGKPTLQELSRHIILGPKWYNFGTQLGIPSKSLDGIRISNNDDVDYRTTRMFELWLDSNPYPTRQQILDTLRLDIIGLNRIAKTYEDAMNSGSK